MPKAIWTIPTQKNTHLVGTCLRCKGEHDGPLAVAFHDGVLEVGVSVGEYFHPLERFQMVDILAAYNGKP